MQRKKARTESMNDGNRVAHDCAQDTLRFKVLSLNCWGLPDVITNRQQRGKQSRFSDPPSRPTRRERFTAISRRLNEFDIIGFQEVWIQSDRLLLKSAAAKCGLSYSHYFKSGIVGSGLFLVSRYPIEDTEFFPFSLNSHPHRIHHGDYHAGKGLGLTRIRAPNDMLLDVYNTHTVAKYDEDDDYLTHRIGQCMEIAEFISLSKRGEAVILLGDLNAGEASRELSILRKMSGLRDPLHGSESHPTNTEEEAEQVLNSHRNRNYDESTVLTHVFDPKRLDYILYGQSTAYSHYYRSESCVKEQSKQSDDEHLRSFDLQVESAFVCMTHRSANIERALLNALLEREPLPEDDDSYLYSDHKGVCVEFSASPREVTHQIGHGLEEDRDEDLSELLNEVRHLFILEHTSVQRRLNVHTFAGILCLILASLFLLFAPWTVALVLSSLIFLFGLLELAYVLFHKRREVLHLYHRIQSFSTLHVSPST